MRIAKYNPSTSNKYPSDGRQFVLHVTGRSSSDYGPREVCMNDGKLLEINYPNGQDQRPVLTGNMHSVGTNYEWSHVAA